MTNNEPKRGPGRPAKVLTERRRRSSGSAMTGTRLSVDKAQLDPNYHYRWINDDPGRIHMMTVNDDYDLVNDPKVKPDTDNTGSDISQVVGTNAGGEAKRAYLARKRKQWYDDDQAEKQVELDKTDASIRRGNFAETDPESASMAGHAYVPEGGISIESNRRKS